MKREPTSWESIFTNDTPDKGLMWYYQDGEKRAVCYRLSEKRENINIHAYFSIKMWKHKTENWKNIKVPWIR